MKPEDFTALTQEIANNLLDQAKVTTILASLVEDYNSVAVETTTAKATAEKLTADNEKLRQANLNLFLQVGTTKPIDDTKPPEDNTPKFENLFDETGNLK